MKIATGISQDNHLSFGAPARSKTGTKHAFLTRKRALGVFAIVCITLSTAALNGHKLPWTSILDPFYSDYADRYQHSVIGFNASGHRNAGPPVPNASERSEIDFSRLILNLDNELLPVHTRQNRSFTVQLCNKHGEPLYASDRPSDNQREPAVLAHITGNELMTLVEPIRLDWGHWQFDYHLVVPGDHEIAVWFENEYLFTGSTENDWVLAEDPRAVLEGFGEKGVSFPAMVRGHIADELDLLLDSMQACEPDDFSEIGFDGRWIEVRHLSKRWLDRLSSAAFDDDRIFLPDRCYIEAMSVEHAQRCLQGQRVSAIGDSTLEELQADLGTYLGQLDKFPTADEIMPYLGDAARVCDTYNQKFRAFSWPTANVTLDMIWIGHHDTCWNGLGISFSYWPGLRERIRLSLANAANILKLPYHTDIPISEDVLMNSSDAQRPAYIVINSGLHDIEAIYKDRAVNFTAYEERLDEIVQMAKNTSAHVIIAHTNPQVGFENVAVRALNAIANTVARKHNLPILPTYAMQKSRWDFGGLVLGGDRNHASKIIFDGSSSPFLRAHTQVLLQLMCH